MGDWPEWASRVGVGAIPIPGSEILREAVAGVQGVCVLRGVIFVTAFACQALPILFIYTSRCN